jgi:hypothetical protein
MFGNRIILPLLLSRIALSTGHGVDPGGSSNNFHNYSLNREISLDLDFESIRVDGETESSFVYNHGDSSVMNINEKAPLSLFFHGGSIAGPSTNEPYVAMAECAFMQHGDAHIDVDDDDDDDDDDQDDGHSSMLSNGSIRRRISTFGDESCRGDERKVLKLSNKSSQGFAAPSSALNNVMNIRGGASVALNDEFAKRLVTAAAVTLLYEGMLGHILEFLKIAMQTAEPGTTYMSIISSITSEKGIGGLWDGFIPWGVIQSIFKGGVFGLAHAIAKANLTPLAENGVMPELAALTLAGGIAGGFQGFVLSPTLLLKTRVMTNPVFREKMSLVKTTLLSLTIGFDVVKNEGIGALMKGSNIFALKRVFDWSTRFYFSDVFESAMKKSGFGLDGNLSPKEKILASLLGGTASTIVTLPLDVIVAKSQDAKKAGVKVSAWETFTKDYKEGGWKGLYDANMMGFEARLAHVCFTTVVMKTGSGIMYDFLYGKKN